MHSEQGAVLPTTAFAPAGRTATRSKRQKRPSRSWEDSFDLADPLKVSQGLQGPNDRTYKHRPMEMLRIPPSQLQSCENKVIIYHP